MEYFFLGGGGGFEALLVWFWTYRVAYCGLWMFNLEAAMKYIEIQRKNLHKSIIICNFA